jgi:ribosomal protein S27E
MTNTNCLKDIRCPHCGYEDRFFIHAEITADVTDGGADIATGGWGSIEWNDDDGIECAGCGKVGTVEEFTIKQSEEKWQWSSNPGPPEALMVK